ncbi:hypothetical protein ACUXG4_004052, partial [Cupriavidus metallidurans]
PHDVREKLVRSSATPGCLIPSVMGFVEQGQGQSAIFCFYFSFFVIFSLR